MKLLVIGFGQCGSHIADEFARANRRARIRRGINMLTDIFAVNTDTADLSSLTTIKSDYQHRILVGGQRAGGHGVGKINERGAEVARGDADKIIDALRHSPKFFDSDAFLLIAGAAGGTGSGAIPVISKIMKERYLDKPLYNLLALPFEHEEQTEERTVFNTATCLKSCGSIADAVILVDNQRYLEKEASAQANLVRINTQTVAPFYNILCAGEETKPKYIGTKVLDAGDIIQTITGWTVLGHGSSRLPFTWFPFLRSSTFREAENSANRGIAAMDKAFSELSLQCNPKEVSRGLFLATGPSQELNLALIKELGEYMRSLAPDAVIRDGDYPRQKYEIDVSIILSGLQDMPQIKRYYTEATSVAARYKDRQEQVESKLREIDEDSKDVPTLV